MNRKCICGGEMVECQLNTSPALGIIIPDKYNFPKGYLAKVYVCKNCGKVDIYADIDKKEKP